MLMLREQVQEAAVLRAWALAEFSNPERWTKLATGVPSDILNRVRNGQELSDHELGALEGLIRQFRSPLLNGLFALNPCWYNGTIAIEDLAAVRLIAYAPFVSAAPTRLLKDLVVAIERNVPVGDEGFNRDVLRMAKAFDLTRMRGVPILATTTTNDPCYLVEGATRCAAMLLAGRAGRILSDTAVPILIGITPRLPAWRWY